MHYCPSGHQAQNIDSVTTVPLSFVLQQTSARSTYNSATCSLPFFTVFLIQTFFASFSDECHSFLDRRLLVSHFSKEEHPSSSSCAGTDQAAS
jgi:hypothetical protein